MCAVTLSLSYVAGGCEDSESLESGDEVEETVKWT